MAQQGTAKQKTRFWIYGAFALSLALHITFLPIPVRNISDWSTTQAPQEKVIKVSLRTQEAQQIVNSINRESDAPEQEAKFLSERDQFFEKESVAANVGTYKEAGKGNATAVVPEVVKKKSLAKSKSLRFSDLSVDEEVAQQDEETIEQQFMAMGLEHGFESESGLAQNNDYVEDLPLGDVTQFNTQEYKYYGFYHRIRQRLEQHWGNSLQESAERLYRTGRRLPASVQSITSLSVTMDDRGNIINVHIRSASGVNELDAAAVESFNRAGPFPNPPQGMVKNGQIQIEWGFVVKS